MVKWMHTNVYYRIFVKEVKRIVLGLQEPWSQSVTMMMKMLMWADSTLSDHSAQANTLARCTAARRSLGLDGDYFNMSDILVHGDATVRQSMHSSPYPDFTAVTANMTIKTP